MSEALVNNFYSALARRDGEAMAECYHQDIVFEDPAFGELTGEDAGDMWRMLCSSDTDLTVTHEILEIDEGTATVNWIASYTFTTTGRRVRNDVTANMSFRDGLIADHRDAFSFWKWSGQALGLSGRLLGWLPGVKKKVKARARMNLKGFQAKQNG